MRKLTLKLCLWFVVCLVGALPTGCTTAEPEQTVAVIPEQTIAVFNIDWSDAPLDVVTRVKLDSYMYGRFASAGFKIAPYYTVGGRVDDRRRLSQDGCDDLPCRSAIGKELAAQKLLLSRLIQIGGSCWLLSQIYDIKTETMEKVAEATGSCTEEGIAASIDRVIAAFKGEVDSTSVASRVETKQVPDRGSRVINVSIWLDGELAGETPIAIPENSSGIYQLVLKSPDFVSTEGELVIPDAQHALFQGELVGNWGQIHVTSDPPGAAVRLDDRTVKNKTTPCVLERVKPGLHTVGFELDGYTLRDDEVIVEQGETASVSIKLYPEHGHLAITSSYTDGVKCEGDLRIDGKLVGKTPWAGFVTAVVPHIIEVQCPDGKARREVFVRVNWSEEEEVVVKVMPKSVGSCLDGWCLIPAGRFKMGSPLSEEGREEDEGPVHSVRIKRPFYMKQVQVTQGEWVAVKDGSDGSIPDDFGPCGENCPADSVSWFEAVAYANVLSEKEGYETCYTMSGCRDLAPGVLPDLLDCVITFKGVGCKGYRLPTEAEWEYAARAGDTGTIYGDPEEIAWYSDNSSLEIHPVAQKAPNAWGLYDMFGNVGEWVQDKYHDSYHRAPTDGSAWESPEGIFRGTRGGSWYCSANDVRAADRDRAEPDHQFEGIGFRLVRSVR